MKKLLLSAIVLLGGTFATYAQNDANAIVDRYMKETNLVQINESQEFSLMTDAIITAQSTDIPFKCIMQNPGKKMRIDIEQMGQKITFIINGKKAWMQMPGMIQAIPEAQVEQMANQFDIAKSLQLDKEKSKFEFVEEKDGLQILKITTTDPTEGEVISIAKFNKNTGLLESTESTIKGSKIISTLSNYKTFGDLKLPSHIAVAMDGKAVSTIVIKNFELDYPTAEYMFTEPK